MLLNSIILAVIAIAKPVLSDEHEKSVSLESYNISTPHCYASKKIFNLFAVDFLKKINFFLADTSNRKLVNMTNPTDDICGIEIKTKVGGDYNPVYAKIGIFSKKSCSTSNNANMFCNERNIMCATAVICDDSLLARDYNKYSTYKIYHIKKDSPDLAIVYKKCESILPYYNKNCFKIIQLPRPTEVYTMATTLPTNTTTLPAGLSSLPTNATTLATDSSLPTNITTLPADSSVNITILPTKLTKFPSKSVALPTNTTELPPTASATIISALLYAYITSILLSIYDS